MSILKLSYDDLESPLKACFSYCALFPKDYKIEKEKLIRLWMAQGYIVPDGPGQTLEDVADGYFKNLVQRCFFQNVDMNIGGVELFRIHGLIHELARNVAGQDVATLHSVTSTFGDDVHHVFHLGSRSNGTIFQKCKIRSYISDGFESDFPLVQLLKNWEFLRTLDLHDLNIQILPNSIGKLLHLRFLDLSYNSRLLRLPDSITDLRNLQTLDLHGCYVLKELPKDLAKLVNLRHLDISRCQALNQMPSGLDKLTCLCVLTEFVVGEENSGRLESLQAFTNLRGSLLIRTTENFNTANQDSRYLNGMMYLEKLTVRLKSHENHESLLKTLEPPSSLKSLELFGYDHTTLPTNWLGQEIGLANLLPNLLRIELKDCSNLVRLPSLSELRLLKSLSLVSLRKLEYIQDTTHRTNCSNFFYSLEYLKISYMEDLKGWWNRENVNLIDSQSSFVKLSELVITHCVNLASLPKCVTLETLKLVGVPKEFQMSVGNELRKVETDHVDYLKSLSGQTQSLTTLSINGNLEVTSFSELGDTFFNGCSSLRSLEIMSCSRLTSLNGEWWNHLTALESLQLRLTPQLILTDDDGIPWHLFKTRLRTLQFTGLAITNLPMGMQNLTFLQKLELESCENLECLPEWISGLSSLRSLSISDCETFELIPSKVRGLTSLEFLQVLDCPLVPETFTDRNGNEWDNLRHITVLDIRSNL